MKKIIFFVSLSLISSVAIANDYPTIDVNGTKHYLADSNDASNEFYETADGYCVKQGFEYSAGTFGTIDNVKPLVRLDAQGNVVETFADNQNDNIWVVAGVNCI